MADQSLQSSSGGKPSRLHREGFAVAHLQRRQAVAAVGQQKHSLGSAAAGLLARADLGVNGEASVAISVDVDVAGGDIRFRPVGVDRGGFAAPGAQQLFGFQWGALRGAAAGAELADQHQALEDPFGAVELHEPVAPVSGHEAEFSAEGRARCHLQGALAKGARGEEHHLFAEGAVLLADFAGGWSVEPVAEAAQAEVHQPFFVAFFEGEDRGGAVALGAAGIEGDEGAVPLPQVLQEVLPLTSHCGALPVPGGGNLGSDARLPC